MRRGFVSRGLVLLLVLAYNALTFASHIQKYNAGVGLKALGEEIKLIKGVEVSVKEVERVKSLKVSNVMQKKVVSIDGAATVAEAIRLMRERGVSSLLVDRRSHDDAWGIMTRKDVVNKVIDPSKDPDKVKVFEIMTKPVVMVSPGLALKYCARLMHQAGVRRAPVSDGKDIVGIISNTDIFKALKV